MTKKSIIPIIIAVIVIAAAGGAGAFFALRSGSTTEASASSESEKDTSTSPSAVYEELPATISYNGKTYTKNRDISTILFLGVDTEEKAEIDGSDIGYMGCADTDIIFILNKAEKTIQILELPRDTMVGVDVYNSDHEIVFTKLAQLALQYSSSDSASRSCRLMKNKISELLYNIQIDDYLSMTMNGIVAAVDAMGGITLTFDQDFSDVNEAYTEGATVTLNGTEVEAFVRHRSHTSSDASVGRMNQQSWFIRQLFSQIAAGKVGITTLYNAAADYIETDLYVDDLKTFADYELLSEKYTIPGEYKAGDEYSEFYADDDGIYDMVINLFYIPTEE